LIVIENRDAVERQALRQDPHVLDRGDRDADLADPRRARRVVES
jgi:hypothetical protein